MRKINVNVRVEEGVLNELDLVAKQVGMQRSDLLRELLEYARCGAILLVGTKEFSYPELVEAAYRNMTDEDARSERAERKRQREEGPKRILVCAACHSNLAGKECGHGESIAQESSGVGT